MCLLCCYELKTCRRGHTSYSTDVTTMVEGMNTLNTLMFKGFSNTHFSSNFIHTEQYRIGSHRYITLDKCLKVRIDFTWQLRTPCSAVASCSFTAQIIFRYRLYFFSAVSDPARPSHRAISFGFAIIFNN